MTRRWPLMLAVVVLIGLIGTGLGVTIFAQDENGGDDAPAAAPAVSNPVVAVIAYQSETEYEPDPFEPDRLRRAKTEVKQLILVRADGTIQHKRAW